VCTGKSSSVCVCGISKLHLKTARWKEKDQIMTMRRGNRRISTKRYKRDSFFQPWDCGNFPKRGRNRLVGLQFYFFFSVRSHDAATVHALFSSDPLATFFWNYKNKTEQNKQQQKHQRTQQKKLQKKTQIWRNWQTRKTSNNDQAKRLDCRPQVTTIFQQRLAFDRRRHRRRDHDHVAATTTAIVIMLFSLNEPHSGLAFFQPSQTQANTAS